MLRGLGYIYSVEYHVAIRMIKVHNVTYEKISRWHVRNMLLVMYRITPNVFFLKKTNYVYVYICTCLCIKCIGKSLEGFTPNKQGYL